MFGQVETLYDRDHLESVLSEFRVNQMMVCEPNDGLTFLHFKEHEIVGIDFAHV